MTSWRDWVKDRVDLPPDAATTIGQRITELEGRVALLESGLKQKVEYVPTIYNACYFPQVTEREVFGQILLPKGTLSNIIFSVDSLPLEKGRSCILYISLGETREIQAKIDSITEYFFIGLPLDAYQKVSLRISQQDDEPTEREEEPPLFVFQNVYITYEISLPLTTLAVKKSA